MAIPTTNLTLTNIQTEFGGANPISLSEYYRGGPLVPSGTATSPVDGVPISTSGTIRMGMFRGVSASPPGTVLINALSVNVQGTTGDTGVLDGWMVFWSDGTLQGIGPTGVSWSNTWFSPKTTGVGNFYWVRATLLSGTTPNHGTPPPALNTWIGLGVNSTIGWGYTMPAGSPIQTWTCSMKFEIASDAAGTNILSSSTISITLRRR